MPKRNPWLFIPLLYFLQAIPVTMVQEVAAIVYKDLGVQNELITRWTSLIALPWTLQLIFGPLVDLNFTKRWWIITMQAGIAVGLIATAFVLKAPYFFEISLFILAASGFMSALCNVATDGFAILAMDQTQQAKFAGIMSTFYRLGRLFCVSVLVFEAGLMMKLPPLEVTASGAPVSFKKDGVLTKLSSMRLEALNGNLGSGKGYLVEPPIVVPPGISGMSVSENGDVYVSRLGRDEKIGTLATESGPFKVGSPVRGQDPGAVWVIVMAVGAAIYGLLSLLARMTLPKPEADSMRSTDRAETSANLLRTGYLLSCGLSGYFTANAIVRLGAHGMFAALGGDAAGKWKGWRLPEDNSIPFVHLSLGPIGTELIQLALCATLLYVSVVQAIRLIRGSEVGVALGSFIKQEGFPAILFFVLFYRFGEALVGKITTLFLKDSIDKGGLAIPNEQIGVISSFVGVVGIILGGIVGGLVVSKIGLKKAFIPLALAMHVPNLLYLWASYGTLPMKVLYLDWPGPLNMTLGGIIFVDQFGYGFGFAGYMVYLMWVAQRGNFQTAHYAIGTGMGALCIMLAGVLSGVLQSNFGYRGVFIAVIFASIPGLASLFFVPLDDSHKKIKAAIE
ncbi:MAG: hypothetical protein ABL949_09010 [Fimbriimonadaceae bacterium]